MKKGERILRYLSQAIGGATTILMGVLNVIELAEGSRDRMNSVWLVDAVFLAFALAMLLLLWPVGRLLLRGWRKALAVLAKGFGFGAALGLGVFAVGALMLFLAIVTIDPIVAAQGQAW